MAGTASNPGNLLRVFLVDNGSLRPSAVFALRHLAESLSSTAGFEVEPVSLLHSAKIDPQLLDNQPAKVVGGRLNECIAQGDRHFLFLPLFLGPSLAITDYLPRLIDETKQETPGLSIKIADSLCGSDVANPDPRLARMLADTVRSEIESASLVAPTVAVVDHGTPHRPVNQLRNAVGRQLEAILGDEVSEVIPCSMERRDGNEYDFNEPLLERLDEVSRVKNACVAAMLFLLPGRHAGNNGDVAKIRDALIEKGAFSSMHISPLLGSHPVLLDILLDRVNEALGSRVAARSGATPA